MSMSAMANGEAKGVAVAVSSVLPRRHKEFADCRRCSAVRRRALLGVLGGGAAVGAAGCLERVTPAGRVGAPADESGCPDVADRLVCAPAAESAPIALTVDSRSVSLPATVEFSLTNGTAATLSTNPYSWGLWKRVDGEWHHLVPDIAPMPLMRLQPGSSHEWELTAEHALPAEPGRVHGSWESAGTVGGLCGGEYAFTTDGWFGDDPEETVGFGVLFDADAPALTLEPTARVTGSSRDGEVVTVRGDGHGEENDRAEFVLRRVDEADDPREVIPEQAAHDYRLRNTLSYVEAGIERVRYVETGHTTGPAFGVDEPYTISYRGELYEACASQLGSE
jgi:hypothetical protein